MRLAQALAIPVADGVLTLAGDGYAYVSLEVALPGHDLPDMRESDGKIIARKYLAQAAAVVAFDYWIGNRDRGTNIKAAIRSEHVQLFRAFDHQFSLLDIEADPKQSIARLRSGELIVAHHPFVDSLTTEELRPWFARVAGLPAETVRSCCAFERPFRTVLPDVQAALASALIKRAEILMDMLPQIKEGLS